MSNPTVKSDHQPRVLIVDDEPHNRELLEIMLASEGVRFSMAASGEEALRSVAAQQPDLILLDVMMPGMDGYQVTTAIKSNPATENIPIIVVTALDDPNARMRALDCGAEDFLAKPVDRAELCARARNLLRFKAYSDYHDTYSQMLEAEVAARTAELVASEQLYRSTFDEAPVGIVRAGLDGRWLRVNRRLCLQLGYTHEELERAGMHQRVRLGVTEDETEVVRRMAEGILDRHVIDEARYRRKDGTIMWARVHMSVHRTPGGSPEHIISVIEDIAERRTLEAQVRQATKMDAIGQLASGVAHDFNNLMTVILGFTDFVVRDKALPAHHADDLNEVVRAAHRAAALSKQLLAFSRQQVLSAVALDVNTLITEMTRMLERLIGANTTIDLSLMPGLPLAWADQGQVEQVVMNLVVNARDAMPGGGTVSLRTEAVELENSVFHEQLVVPGAYVMIAVTDTGTGMSAATRAHLFEPFFTTKEPGLGTGLGLSTVYGIVKQSKGHIWVYSEPGQGTTFKVYLPLAHAVDTREPAIKAPTELPRGSETVLLVEDKDAIRQFAARILADAGYAVVQATNADDAEKAFALNANAIDLVLTDVVMPGCGGPELVSRLRQYTPDVRALYMSGYLKQSGEGAIAGDACETAPETLLQKPFTAAQLAAHVRGALVQ